MKSGYFHSYKTKGCFIDCRSIMINRYTKCGMIFGSYLKHQMLRIERKIMKIRVMERRRKKKRRGGRDCA